MRVGVGLPDDPNRACTNFPINRRAGCPQPADWPCAALPAGHTGPALQKCCVLPRADRVVRPYKEMPCRAGPMCPAAHRTPCKKPLSLRASDRRHWCGNPYPLRRAALAGRGRTSASTAFGASGRRPLRRAIGKRCVRVGLPDDPHRACANFPINRRAGCPQPADWPCAVLPAGHTGPALQGKRIPTSLRSSE